MLNSTARTTKASIEKYLGSGMVEGSGPIYSNKSVEKFGEKIFDTIEQESALLGDMDAIPTCGVNISGDQNSTSCQHLTNAFSGLRKNHGTNLPNGEQYSAFSTDCSTFSADFSQPRPVAC
jgi:hypothetical protein